MSRSLLTFLVAGAVGAGVTGCAPGPEDREPDDLRGFLLGEPLAKPEVVLTSTDGTPFNLREATNGLVTLVFFGYTNCPDICPVHMANLGSVVGTLAPRLAGPLQPELHWPDRGLGHDCEDARVLAARAGRDRESCGGRARVYGGAFLIGGGVHLRQSGARRLSFRDSPGRLGARSA